MARICGSVNLLVLIKISSIIKPEKILLLKPVNCRGITHVTARPRLPGGDLDRLGFHLVRDMSRICVADAIYLLQPIGAV